MVSKLRDKVKGFKLNPLDVGGAALRDGHSSQEEESETEAVWPNRHRERARWVTITVNADGDKLKVLAKRGNGIYIEYTGEAIILICSLVHQTRRGNEAEANPDHASLLTPVDEGRVTNSLTKKAYRVTYKPKAGRMCHKLLEVKNGDAKMTLALARRYWNQYDASGETPYSNGIL